MKPAGPIIFGSETPRLYTKPLRELTPETSLGFEAIEFAEGVVGMTLLPWQKWLLIHMLELNEDGTFRFRTVVVLVGRQNGKTTLLEVLALWRMYVDGCQLVIGTAQDLDVAEEVWEATVEMAKGVPELAAEIEGVDRAAGKKALKLTTGERYKVKAANRRGGRGLSADLVVLDELREHQKWDAWGAVTKTTMARKRPQVVCLSNAGDAQSVVLAHLRTIALKDLAAAGDAEALAALKAFLAKKPGDQGEIELGEEADDDLALGMFEWSARAGCDLDDVEGLAAANPSLGHIIPMAALRSAMKTDDEAVFRTECLCQWVDDMVPPLFGRGQWEGQVDESSVIVSKTFIGVEVSIDRKWASLGAGGLNEKDQIHVELTGRGHEIDHRKGVNWVVPRMIEIQDASEERIIFALDPRGPASSLVPAITNAGLELILLDTNDMCDACAGMFDAVKQGRLVHLDQEDLNVAALGARERTIGDRWGIGRRSSEIDVSPLVAVTIASWLVETQAVDIMQSVW